MTPYENMMHIAYFFAGFMAVFTVLVYWNYFKYYYKKDDKEEDVHCRDTEIKS